MPKRVSNYEPRIAEKIRSDPEYAEHFIRASMENHGDSFEEALANAIDQYGHAEMANALGKPANNVTRTVHTLRNNGDIKLSTLKALMKGFGINKETQYLDSIIADTSSFIDVDESDIWNTFKNEERTLEYGT